eukprot:TRINITY_DN4398_c0_g1_i1.p1 TRINITY_DN4398_c0_g1~~TRINITY_DN4398_c0_g1_i1.p1  ORF type:complete len:194 (-),score=44.34 TRINITY_DN4398_c0_g1_i1:862-1443(-)
MEGGLYYNSIGYVEDEEYPPYCLKRSDSSGSVTESSISSQSEHGSNSSTFSYEEHCGPGLRSFLVKRLSSHLSVLDFSPLHLERMTSDILRLSESEPYGIRGATLIFKVFDPKGKQDFKIPPLKIDAGCVSTFRLIFNLKEESLLISNIGRALSGFFKSWRRNGAESRKSPPRISLQDYQVSKKQLYRSFDYS